MKKVAVNKQRIASFQIITPLLRVQTFTVNGNECSAHVGSPFDIHVDIYIYIRHHAAILHYMQKRQLHSTSEGELQFKKTPYVIYTNFKKLCIR